MSQLLRIKKSTKLRAWIDPNIIIYPRSSNEWPRYLKKWPFFACPGNWDLYNYIHHPFKVYDFIDIINNKINYRESNIYKRLVREIRYYGKSHAPSCSTIEEVEQYFFSVFKLYNNLLAYGYLPSDITHANDDINTRISRYGEFFKCGEGTHRLALSRIIGIPSVVITIDLVHINHIFNCVVLYRSSPIRSLKCWLRDNGLKIYNNH